MGGVFGITGSPGTGKKTVSPMVATRLGLRCVSLNNLAQSYGLVARGGEVDTGRMRRRLARDPTQGLIYGHLLPYVLEPRLAGRVAVLRCDPAVLKRRLVARGYPARKVAENVEAELIGVVSADAFESFGSAETFEVDTTRSGPRSVAGVILAIVRGRSAPPPRMDWTTRYDSGRKLRSLLSDGE